MHTERAHAVEICEITRKASKPVFINSPIVPFKEREGGARRGGHETGTLRDGPGGPTEGGQLLGLMQDLATPEALWDSYYSLKKSPGNLLGDSAAISKELLLSTVKKLQEGRYEFFLSTRLGNNHKDSCTLQNPQLVLDLIVEHALTRILEEIYLPRLSEGSLGFRYAFFPVGSPGPVKKLEGRGFLAFRDKALKELTFHFQDSPSVVRWMIEGGLSPCSLVPQKKLLEVLREVIADEKFLTLIKRLFQNGSRNPQALFSVLPSRSLTGPSNEKGRRREGRTRYHTVKEGIGVGLISRRGSYRSLISPILFHIYLDKLDKFVGSLQGRRGGGENGALPNGQGRLRAPETALRGLPRFYYTRYEDRFLIGIAGTFREALDLKEQVLNFTRQNLLLTPQSPSNACFSLSQPPFPTWGIQGMRMAGGGTRNENTRTRDLGREGRGREHKEDFKITPLVKGFNFLGIDIGQRKQPQNPSALRSGRFSSPPRAFPCTPSGTKERERNEKGGNLPQLSLKAPINALVLQLKERGFLKSPCRGDSRSFKSFEATGVGPLTNLEHRGILLHYNAVIRDLWKTYALADNRKSLGSLVHALKHSCALTLALKYKLRGRAKAFKKFGKELQCPDSGTKFYTPPSSPLSLLRAKTYPNRIISQDQKTNDGEPDDGKLSSPVRRAGDGP